MNRRMVYVLAICISLTSTVFAESLLNQYHQKIKGIELNDKNTSSTHHDIQIEEDDIFTEIQEIKQMKQGTFEATPTFLERRNNKIKALKDKSIFYGKIGDKQFSFGSVKMKNYDADSEKMLLTVNWNKNVYTLFPELKRVHIAQLDIRRSEAQELFGEKQTHYFHVEIGYRGNNLIVTSMLLYGKYRFYAKVKKLPVITPVVKQTYQPTHMNSHASCEYYYVNASSVNVRSRAMVRSVKRGKLNLNKRVCVTKKNASWYYIKNKGWVLGRFLQKTKVKKKHKIKKRRDRFTWYCSARSGRASGWVERVGKANAKRGAIRQCTMRLQTRIPCRITNCYKR